MAAARKGDERKEESSVPSCHWGNKLKPVKVQYVHSSCHSISKVKQVSLPAGGGGHLLLVGINLHIIILTHLPPCVDMPEEEEEHRKEYF